MKKHLRWIALTLLAVITVLAAWQFVTGDWRAALQAWRGRWEWVALALAANYAGIFCDYLCWRWTYHRLGLRTAGVMGGAIYWTVYATQLVPMQLGRLVRPDAMARQDGQPLNRAMKAEGVLFYIDLTALGAVLVGLAVWLARDFLPEVYRAPLGAAAPVAAVIAAAVSLGLARTVARFFSETPLDLRTAFWLRWETFLTVLLRATDWMLLGVVLYMLVAHLPGSLSFDRVVFSTLVSNLIGSGSGLPGGVGATEGILWYFLRMLEMPETHDIIAVGLFRGMTFWLQIPIGWAAVVYVNRRLGKSRMEES